MIYAWRAWQIGGARHYLGAGDYLLCSIGVSGTWSTGVMKASHAGMSSISVSGHPVPGENCTCGLWATKKPRIPLDYATSSLSGHIVIGVVGLWGRIVPHELGYRAQYARPYALVEDISSMVRDSYPRIEVVHALARRYEVPTLPSIKAAAQEFKLQQDLLNTRWAAKWLPARWGPAWRLAWWPTPWRRT